MRQNSASLSFLMIFMLPASAFLLAFFFVPLGFMVVTSFLAPGIYGGVQWQFYPDNFGRIFGFSDPLIEEFDPIYLSILMRSLRIACVTVILLALLCYPAALIIRRFSQRKQTVCLFLISLPFFSSLVVRLYAWVIILRPGGFINEVLLSLNVIHLPLSLVYTDGAIIVGLIYIFLPFMFLPIFASLEKLDSQLIYASLDLGAGRLRTFLRVVLPLTAPGIAAGALIVFIPALGNFIVPSVLGGAQSMMIGNLIENQYLYARNWPFGSALAMAILLCMLILLFLKIFILKAYQIGKHTHD